jgi:shikimate kinase
MSDRRIVILGFMACGKTTVGQELARQMDCQFVDLDSFITERTGHTPAEIISQDGETFFRDVETLALRDLLQDTSVQVIALGGGTWTIPANRTLVALHNCATIWLDAPFEVCWERIETSTNVRPLAPTREEALAKFESRRADYASAERQISISASDLIETVVDVISKEI